jgi:hypothetical protein
MSKQDPSSTSEETRRRSDDIRRRRTTQSHTTRQKEKRTPTAPFLGGLTGRSTARRRVSSVDGLPPVMARGFPTQSSPARKVHANKSRRLYNVSLNAQGAEMRLPALPRFGLSWRAASLTLLAFLAGVLYYFWTAPGFQVSEAQISGLKRMTRGDVNKALALTGKPIFALDAGEVQQQLLESFPEFSQVAAQIELPNTLAITVTERLPVLIWRQDGVSNLVDEQGMTFPARDEAALSAYPVIEASGDPPLLPGTADPSTAEETSLVLEKVITDSLTLGLPVKGEASPFLDPETVAALLQVVDQAPNGAAIIYEPAHGFGWLDRRGWKVFLGQMNPGDPAQIETKLMVYRAIMEEVKSAGAKPAFISVEFVHVPYYQLEPSE